MSGLGLENIQELFLVESIHYRQCTQIGSRTKIQYQRKKLSRLQLIMTNVATLESYTENSDALVLDALKVIITKTKRSLFGIYQLNKHIQRGGKLNGIVINKVLIKIWLLMKLGQQIMFFMRD